LTAAARSLARAFLPKAGPDLPTLKPDVALNEGIDRSLAPRRADRRNLPHPSRRKRCAGATPASRCARSRAAAPAEIRSNLDEVAEHAFENRGVGVDERIKGRIDGTQRIERAGPQSDAGH